MAMRRPSVLRIALLATIAWGVSWCVISLTSFFNEDALPSVSRRHEIRHILAESSADGARELVTHFDEQWFALNRGRLWHAATALLLAGVSVEALRRGQASVR